MSSLYLLRHGQAAFGNADYDQLSPLGLEQARATGAFFASRQLRFDAVLVGPRQRHRSTAEAVLAALVEQGSAPTLVTEPGLDEFAEGSALLDSARARLPSGVVWPQERGEQLRLYSQEVLRWAEGATDIPGTVPLAAFTASVTAWLQQMVQAQGSGRRLLAVSSAGTIAVLVAHVLQLPRIRLGELLLALGNASLTELLFSRGRVSLRVFNSTHHLPAELASHI